MVTKARENLLLAEIATALARFGAETNTSFRCWLDLDIGEPINGRVFFSGSGSQFESMGIGTIDFNKKSFEEDK